MSRPANTASPALPVTIVTGLSEPAKAAYRALLADAQPAGRNIAWVDQSGLLPRAASGVARAASRPDAGAMLSLAAGCVCCVGQAQFQARLPRLLRARPWDHLVLVLAASSHPAQVIDLLRGAPWCARLRVARVVLIIDPSTAAQYAADPTDDRAGTSAPAALAQAQLLSADRVILMHHANCTGQAIDIEQLRDRLSARVIGPLDFTQLQAAHDIRESSPTALALDDAAAPPPGMRIDASQADAFTLHAHWPAEVRFDRRPLSALLHRAATTLAPAHADAVFATERAWYRWTIALGRSDWQTSDFRRHSFVSLTAPKRIVNETMLEQFMLELQPLTANGTGCIATRK